MLSHFYARMACIVAFLSLAGCAQSIQIDARDLPFPVLVGPIGSIGHTGESAKKGRLVSRVDGEVSTMLAGGSGTTTQHAYGDVSKTTTTTSVSQGVYNSVNANLMKETQGFSTRTVVIDKIKAVTSAHLSIFGIRNTSISIDGEVWDPK